MQSGRQRVSSVSQIVGPVAMTQVFAHFAAEDAVTYLPGAPFVLAAGLSLAMLVAFLAVKPTAAPSRTV